MPKYLTVKLTVPSGSRPSAMLDWLNKLLNPHRMQVTEVTDDQALDAATPSNDNKDTTGYEAAWRFMHDELKWMQGHPELNAYLGWNLASVANDLIDRAYPGLRDRALKAKETD